MLIEGHKYVKKPMMVNVDVCTKCIIGITMENGTEEECLKELKKVDAPYKRNNSKMQQLVFDQEPGIVPLEETILENGLELKLKDA